jgi:hypothetical protein
MAGAGCTALGGENVTFAVTPERPAIQPADRVPTAICHAPRSFVSLVLSQRDRHVFDDRPLRPRKGVDVGASAPEPAFRDEADDCRPLERSRFARD